MQAKLAYFCLLCNPALKDLGQTKLHIFTINVITSYCDVLELLQKMGI